MLSLHVSLCYNDQQEHKWGATPPKNKNNDLSQWRHCNKLINIYLQKKQTKENVKPALERYLVTKLIRCATSQPDRA